MMNHDQQEELDDPTHTGRTILTALYLCMLGVCFVVPIYFYTRMHCDDRAQQRLRDLEITHITQAMNQSQDLHREESRAVRRKYREERRARIIQLFTPVRMILKEENFIRSKADIKRQPTLQENHENKEIGDIDDDNNECCSSSGKGTTLEVSSNDRGEEEEERRGEFASKDDDNNNHYILIPKPGLDAIDDFNNNLVIANKTATQDINDLRKVPNECSICLCEYEIGSAVVFSSNRKCEHVFHADCIEQWLMKQRGIECPICRQDFVIDPFDDVEHDLESGNYDSSAITSETTTVIASSAESPTVSHIIVDAHE